MNNIDKLIVVALLWLMIIGGIVGYVNFPFLPIATTERVIFEKPSMPDITIILNGTEEVDCECTTIEYAIPSLDALEATVKAAKVYERAYDVDTHNCVHFSYELIHELNKKGYYTSTAVVDKPNSSHLVVVVKTTEGTRVIEPSANPYKYVAIFTVSDYIKRKQNVEAFLFAWGWVKENATVVTLR